MTEKPAYGAPCNNCGACCRAELCLIGITLFGSIKGPCPALREEDSRCGIVATPAAYVPFDVALHGEAKMRDAAAEILGVGMGCDSFEFRVEAHTELGRIMRNKWKTTPKERVEEALRLWRIDRDEIPPGAI